MSSLLLDIEIGVTELVVTALVLFGTYLAWQWWSAQKVASSGINGASSPAGVASVTPLNLKGTAGTKAGAGAAAGANGTEPKLPLSIFFGSQSGTAETFAHELAAEGRTFGFKAVVHDLQDYDRDSLQEEAFVVFLLATFGEGDPTDNAAEFYTWVNEEEREKDLLKKTTFGVFALGNRQYEHFCNIGRRVDQRLAELGGTRLLEHGEGDDDGSLEDDFAGWKASFWARTKATFGLQNEHALHAKFKPNFALEWKSAEQSAKYIGGLTPAICDPKHKPILATVVANRQLRTDVPEAFAVNPAGESTRHLDLDVSAMRLAYVTADNLGVCPCNGREEVDGAIKRLGVEAGAVFTLRALGKRKAPISQQCSVRDALTWYLDFQALPRAALLTTLAQYTEDEEEKATLNRWTKDAGREEFMLDQLSVIEVLERLPGVKVPFLDFLELCPKVQPRFYTISSSSLVQPKVVSITVALSTHQKPRGRVYKGLATTYLCGLSAENKDKVCVFLRPSTFRLPKPKRTFVNGSPSPTPSPGPDGQAGAAAVVASNTSMLPPVLMVGPGTGVAPFRAFVQEFHYLRSKALPAFPETHLFFGCRRRAEDFIYENEFAEAQKNGSLSKLHTAFSRETDQKVYVQSKLREEGEMVWKLISTQRAYFYVCGGTLMGRQVKEAVQHIVEQHGNLSAQAAAEYVKKMQSEGRYIQELWSALNWECELASEDDVVQEGRRSETGRRNLHRGDLSLAAVCRCSAAEAAGGALPMRCGWRRGESRGRATAPPTRQVPVPHHQHTYSAVVHVQRNCSVRLLENASADGGPRSAAPAASSDREVEGPWEAGCRAHFLRTYSSVGVFVRLRKGSPCAAATTHSLQPECAAQSVLRAPSSSWHGRAAAGDHAVSKVQQSQRVDVP